MTYHSWRVHYGDGTALRGRTFTEWTATPSAGVQVVTIFSAETYQIWKQDRYDAKGFPVNQRLETERYCEILHSQDYYWFDGSSWGSGSSESVPRPLPVGAVKTGQLVSEADFYAAYNDAEKSRVA
jgi:hypothetical protein